MNDPKGQIRDDIPIPLAQVIRCCVRCVGKDPVKGIWIMNLHLCDTDTNITLGTDDKNMDNLIESHKSVVAHLQTKNN